MLPVRRKPSILPPPRDELSTGQGSSLRRRAALALGAGTPLAPQVRSGLSVQTVKAQAWGADRRAQASAAKLDAVSGALEAVRVLNAELLSLARDVPAREAVFTAALPSLKRSLVGVTAPQQRLDLAAAVDRLALMVNRSHHRALADAVAPTLKPVSAELQTLAQRRPTPFMKLLASLARV